MGRTATSAWIVVPTLNEVRNIGPLLERIHAQMAGIRYSACVVDDGSKDGTVERVREMMDSSLGASLCLIQRKKRFRGSQRGIAVWTGLYYGLHHSDSDAFVEMDGDLSHLPEELPLGLRAVRDGHNVAIASKYLSSSRVLDRPFGRRALSFFANQVVRTLISRSIRDYSNGYRFYDRECVSVICGHRLRYGSPIYLSEVLALLLAHGMDVREFPGTYVGRGEGVSKLRGVDLTKAAIAVVDIAARYHLHRRGFQRRALSVSPDDIASIEHPRLARGQSA